ncbi:JPH2 protein, partial [Anseranas semipalmata]|nr:JPH2 protein [Anseranas semipalmata]
PGSWGEVGGGTPEGEGRPASRGTGRPAEQMEIGPLQRMAREPDVELFKGYHSYAVRTSPVSPTADYEEEPLPEPGPPSPVPRGEPQRRGGTPLPPQEPEEKPVPRAEAKAEQPRPKEVKQRPSPERRAVGRSEPATDRKTEARALARTEHKAGAKRGPAPMVAAAAAQDADECDEGPNTIVICMVILLNIGLAILFVHFLT